MPFLLKFTVLVPQVNDPVNVMLSSAMLKVPEPPLNDPFPERLLETVNVKAAISREPFIARFEQAASAVNVTVCPAEIVAVFPATGKPAPLHVASSFQAPDAIEV